MTRTLRLIGLAIGLTILLCGLTPLPAAGKKPPLATMTEVRGKTEVQRGQKWEPVYPLQPLYSGDVLRIGPGGQATLMYLGASLEIIGEAQSPYTVTEKKAKSGQRNNVTKKIGIIMQRLVQGEEERSSLLTTRGPAYPKAERLRVLYPDETSVLFGSGSATLQWAGGQPPYHLAVFGLGKQGQEAKVLENDATDLSFAVPFDTLVEDTYYRWQVTSGEQQTSGTFHVLSRAATAAVQAELSGLLQRIPGENAVTKALVQFGYLVDHALVYDANVVLIEAKAKFPGNRTFQNLSIY